MSDPGLPREKTPAEKRIAEAKLYAWHEQTEALRPAKNLPKKYFKRKARQPGPRMKVKRSRA